MIRIFYIALSVRNTMISAIIHAESPQLTNGNTRMTSIRARQPLPFIILVAASALVIWLVLRFGLWLMTDITQMRPLQVVKAFGVGVWFDAVTLSYLLVPLLLVPSSCLPAPLT